MDAHYYHVDVNWQMDRKGNLCSPELSKENAPCIEVAYH